MVIFTPEPIAADEPKPMKSRSTVLPSRTPVAVLVMVTEYELSLLLYIDSPSAIKYKAPDPDDVIPSGFADVVPKLVKDTHGVSSRLKSHRYHHPNHRDLQHHHHRCQGYLK